jgi:hypothetical protein
MSKKHIDPQLKESDKDLLEHVKRHTDEGNLWEYQVDLLPYVNDRVRSF